MFDNLSVSRNIVSIPSGISKPKRAPSGVQENIRRPSSIPHKKELTFGFYDKAQYPI